MLAHESQKQGVVQNITTILDQEVDNILKDFRCNACGRTVFQYYGGIQLILPGNVTVDWIDIVGRPKPIKCKNRRKLHLDDGRTVEVKCNVVYFVIG